ncbi:MAG: hypothetical protein HYX91_02235 [Chloroflexi bacterium]|nr:hypothetical protein [Chloroflexota bacterium]
MDRLKWPLGVLILASLLLGGCAREAAGPQPAPVPTPVSEVLPAEHPTDFPRNLRRLTEAEKGRAIEISLDTPAAREQRQKDSQYRTHISWIALDPSREGEGYSGYRKFDYDIVEKGIPRGTMDVTPPGSPERIVSVGVPDDAEIYPNVTISFGEPPRWIVSVAVDLDAEKAVYVEEYPFRTGPTLPMP